MIIKIHKSKSSSAKSLADKVFDETKRPELIRSNFCMDAGDKKAFLKELRENLAQRPEIRKPVFHAVLSASPDDQIENEKWESIVKDYMDEMGFGDCAYVAMLHYPLLVYIIASRIDVGRELVSDAFDISRSHKLAHELEIKYNLHRITRKRFQKDAEHLPERSISQNEDNMQKRLNQPSIRSQIRKHLDEEERLQTMSQLVESLAQKDITVLSRLNKNRSEIIGICFQKDGLIFSGSKIHRSYSWPNIQKQFQYDSSRDSDLLSQTTTKG